MRAARDPLKSVAVPSPRLIGPPRRLHPCRFPSYPAAPVPSRRMSPTPPHEWHIQAVWAYEWTIHAVAATPDTVAATPDTVAATPRSGREQHRCGRRVSPFGIWRGLPGMVIHGGFA